MGTLDETSPTLADERFLAVVDDAVAGRSRYPLGAAFIDATRLEEFAPIVARYVREGRPIVLMYPDGEKRVLRADPYFGRPTGWAARLKRLRWPIRLRSRRREKIAPIPK